MAWTIFTVETTDDIVLHSHNEVYRSLLELDFAQDCFATDSPTEQSESGTPAPPPFLPSNILRFTTDHMPKDPTAGFVFGTDKDKCDVLLHVSRDSGISGKQFAVTFRTDTGAIILRNLSRATTRIKSTNESHVQLSTQRVIVGNDVISVYLPGLVLHLLRPWEDSAVDHQYTSFLATLALVSPDLGRMYLQSSVATRSSAGSSPSSYHLDRVIGQGTSAIVYRASHTQTGDVVAVKCFGSNGKRLGDPWKEGQILCSLRHEHIIQFYEFNVRCKDGPQLIMEYAAYGSLLAQSQIRKLNDREGRTIIRQTLDGLTYLHREKVTHRDLKPGNILLASRQPIHVKIADFSISARAAGEYNTLCGTELYAAPEIWNPPYTEKIDIWSVGIIVMELWVGLPKYNRDTWAQDVMTHKATASSNVATFLDHLLQLNPSERSTAHRCLILPFVTRGRHKEVLSDLHPLHSRDQTVPMGEDEFPDTAVWTPMECVKSSSRLQETIVLASPPTISNSRIPTWHTIKPESWTPEGCPDSASSAKQPAPPLAAVLGESPADPNSRSPGDSLDRASSAAEHALVISSEAKKQTSILCRLKKPPGLLPRTTKPRIKGSFDFVAWGDVWIPYDYDDRTINITHIFRAVGLSRHHLQQPSVKSMMIRKVIVRSRSIQGTFIPYEDAIRICGRSMIDTNFLETLIA